MIYLFLHLAVAQIRPNHTAKPSTIRGTSNSGKIADFRMFLLGATAGAFGYLGVFFCALVHLYNWLTVVVEFG